MVKNSYFLGLYITIWWHQHLWCQNSLVLFSLVNLYFSKLWFPNFPHNFSVCRLNLWTFPLRVFVTVSTGTFTLKVLGGVEANLTLRNRDRPPYREIILKLPLLVHHHNYCGTIVPFQFHKMPPTYLVSYPVFIIGGPGSVRKGGDIKRGVEEVVANPRLPNTDPPLHPESENVFEACDI